MPAQGAPSVPIVVLTGGIASGKSAVSSRLAQLGIPVVDTDEIAREVVERNTPGLKALVEAFGSEILLTDGALDRRALKRLIFQDDKARIKLESILHPLIERSARDQIKAIKNAPYCLVVVPLLVESGLFPDADLVVTVDVSEETQRQRLKSRDGLSDETISQILRAQASRDQRLERADLVLTNSDSLEALEAQIERLQKHLLDQLQSHQRPD